MVKLMAVDAVYGLRKGRVHGVRRVAEGVCCFGVEGDLVWGWTTEEGRG